MRYARLATLTTVVIVWPAGLAVTEPQVPAFRSGVELVRLDVLVTDDGRPVKGLTSADFEVTDNGVRQQVNLFSVEEVPLTMLLVLDTSLSVQGAKREALLDAAHAALGGLRSGDRAGLLTFSHELHLASTISGDLDAVRMGLDRMEPDGQTALVDGVHAGTAVLQSDPERSLMLVFTDGFENASWLRPESVLDTLKRSDVVVYGVTTTPLRSLSQSAELLGFRPSTKTFFLTMAAGISGGRVLEATSAERLRAAFAEIVEEFKARYLLSYEPRGAGGPGWHEVRVRLRRGKRGDMTTRPGYYMPAGSSSRRPVPRLPSTPALHRE
ncbi:MAG: VWA domain-containing protein [Acidobacteriota bacterium]